MAEGAERVCKFKYDKGSGKPASAKHDSASQKTALALPAKTKCSRAANVAATTKTAIARLEERVITVATMATRLPSASQRRTRRSRNLRGNHPKVKNGPRRRKPTNLSASKSLHRKG